MAKKTDNHFTTVDTIVGEIVYELCGKVMSVMRNLHKLLSVKIHHHGINKIYAANSIAYIITNYNHHQLCAVLAAKYGRIEYRTVPVS